MKKHDYIARENITKTSLFPKQFFGGRTLLKPNIKQGLKSYNYKPALFSIIAHSHSVKLYLITNKTL
jgi:hypothetical protein